MLFELYYLGFGQMIAAFSPNELLASLLVPMFFTFIVSFCGKQSHLRKLFNVQASLMDFVLVHYVHDTDSSSSIKHLEIAHGLRLVYGTH
jgi:hypothetical protein